MEESDAIVANWTRGEGNHPCVSSKDNVLAVARLGRTGGLASDQAATLRNHCSVVNPTHMNAVCGTYECAEPLQPGRRQYSRGSSDKCTWETLRRMGGSMVTRTGMQSREGPQSISATAGRPKANSRSVWEWGLAHEGVVAMTPVITSRRSEGPLGHCGRGMRDGPGYCSNELTCPPECWSCYKAAYWGSCISTYGKVGSCKPWRSPSQTEREGDG